AGSWAGAAAGALGSHGVYFALGYLFNLFSLEPNVWLSLMMNVLGFTLGVWRPIVFYPFQAAWNTLLYRADERRAAEKAASGGAERSASGDASHDRSSLLRWHAAMWDELQRLPLFGLEQHLVLVVERNPDEGQAAIDYVSAGHQQWAAQAAQIELDARQLERCADVEAISNTHRRLAAGELEGPASALLRSLSRISRDVEAALQQESTYNQRLALSAIEDRLDGLLRELTRSSERYAFRFRPVATHWRRIVAARVRELVEAAEIRQEIDNPYVIGVPLTEQQEIFVGRTDVSARIEGLLLDRRRPPLLLYGQRRMGKTSLLNNLGRLLPETIVPLFVDLQGPVALARDHASFFYNMARSLIDSASRQRGLALPRLTREALADDPFTRFDEWLDEVEAALDAQGHSTALLALDEFEALDNALTDGRLSEAAVLGTLRHIIQHRLRFKVLLAGSHTLDEFKRWAGYLINAQVLGLGYLNEAEACQLIERPVKDFALRYEPEATRRILDLTRGHPFLVQLLCAEIVSLKNEQEVSRRRRARRVDVEAAVPEALSRGSLFFADIERNQVGAAGLALLRFMAVQGEEAVVGPQALARHCPDPLERTLELLLRRDLIESVDGGYRFQVEMIRRWFIITNSVPHRASRSHFAQQGRQLFSE
ncbi:MAG: AAA family ATPase, partial [Anaerolineae bacterium]